MAKAAGTAQLGISGATHWPLPVLAPKTLGMRNVVIIVGRINLWLIPAVFNTLLIIEPHVD